MKNNRIARRLLRDIDKHIYELLKKHDGFIAGGAVLSALTSKKINDYDIYFSDEEACHKFIDDLKLKDKKSPWTNVDKRQGILEESMKANVEIFKTSTAITFFTKKKKYQVVTAFYLPVMDLFKKYDFTVCMVAYHPKANDFSMYETAMEDIAEKRLKFNIGTEFPIVSLLRVIKYQQKGFIISGLEMIKLALTVHALKLHDYATLKAQLQGIDTLFLKELTDILSTEKFAEKEYEFDAFIHMFDEYIDRKEGDFFSTEVDENPEE
jgi:hypothetical protein